MNTKRNLPIVVLFIFCSSLLFAQSEMNSQSQTTRPEIELIIGLSQPTINTDISLTNMSIVEAFMNGYQVGNCAKVDDENNEDLEDYLDSLEDENTPTTEPGKEELILVKLARNLDLQIYPNPAKDHIKLMLAETGNYQVDIYDVIGNKILSKVHIVEYGTELEFNLSNFKTGIYVIHIQSKKASTIKKFAIKH